MGAGQQRQLPGWAGARSQPLSRIVWSQGDVRVGSLSPSECLQASSPEYTRGNLAFQNALLVSEPCCILP